MLKSLILTIYFLLHPVHVSLTSIEYVPELDSLKVFVKLYFDDFLLDAGMSSEKFPDGKSAQDSLLKSIIFDDYLNSRLKIEVNGKKLTGKLNRLEIVDNEVKADLLYECRRKPEKVTVRNLIMTGLYGDQANLTIIRVGEFEEGVKLTSEMTEKEFNIVLKK